MKGWKRFFSLLLALALCLSCAGAAWADGEASEEIAPEAEITPAEEEPGDAPAAEQYGSDDEMEQYTPEFDGGVIASGSCGDKLTWTLTDDGVLTISGTGEMTSCPWNKSQVESIEIQAGVTSIGVDAFSGCRELTSVTIPNSVTSIGDNAFSHCERLTSVTIPDNVTSIGSHAFWGCGWLTSVTIPDSVTSIGDNAFSNTGLTSVNVGKNNKTYHSAGNCIIETASKTLVVGCETSVIPSDGSVMSIGREAFDACFGLTSVTIPDSVTSIGDGAFFDCERLTSVTIPGSVTSIGRYAFYGCRRLTSVTIPDSVTSIGGYAFSACEEVISINVGKNNKNYHSAGNCIIETASKTLVVGCNTSVIPNDGSVTSIGDGAFFACTGLTSVTIPGSVTSIGREAFSYCTGLTSVTIPDSVTGIGGYAFSDCNSLEDVYYSGTEAEWGNIDIGYGNDALKNVVHYGWSSGQTDDNYKCGDNLTWSFSDKTLTIRGTGGMWNYDVNGNLPPWADLNSEIEKIVIEEGVTSIGSYAFVAAMVKSARLPDSLLVIGDHAFQSTSLTEILIPQNVKAVGVQAFYGCPDLKYVGFGQNVELVNALCVAGCSSLISVFFLGDPPQISDDAFAEDDPICGYYSPKSTSWPRAEKSGYGTRITWDVWDVPQVSFEKESYSFQTGDFVWLGITYQSKTVPWFNFNISSADESVLVLVDANWIDYNYLLTLSVESFPAKNGNTTVSAVFKTVVGDYEATVPVQIVEKTEGASVPVVSDTIKYPMEDTYRFSNLSDSMKGNLQYYLKFFSPAQARIISRGEDGTGGQCFGMCMSAVASCVYDSPSVSSYSGGLLNQKADELLDIGSNWLSAETELMALEYIKYAHLYQYTLHSNLQKLDNQARGLDGLYEDVVNYLLHDGPPVILSLHAPESGHAVIVRGIGTNDDSVCELIVYDCNSPKDENCIVRLHKYDGKLYGWDYSKKLDGLNYEEEGYSSTAGAFLDWNTNIDEFIRDFNGGGAAQSQNSNYSYLVSVSNKTSTMLLSDGTELPLTGGTDDYSEYLIPIISTTGDQTDPTIMYWADLGSEFTLNSNGAPADVDIALPDSGVSVSLPQNSAADVTAKDESLTRVDLYFDGPEGGYEVSFFETNEEGDDVDTVTVRGSSETDLSFEKTENGIEVSGNDIGTIEVEVDDATYSYDILEGVHEIEILDDGGVIGTEESSQAALVLQAVVGLRSNAQNYTAADAARMLARGSGLDAGDPDGLLTSGSYKAINWTLTQAGTLTVSGKGDADMFVRLAGMPVQPGEESDFGFIPSVERIVINEGVTGIAVSSFFAFTNMTDITIPVSVTSIGTFAFQSCYSLTDVYYAGTEAQWNDIAIGDGNECLTSARLHFNSRA